MNDHQKLYFDQAKSDFEIFQFLKGKPACHRLHYLQMCTEKLGKAFFFKKPPPYPSHAGFVKFLRNLSTRRNIWRALNFGRREDLELYVRGIHQIAQDVESLAPQLADDGPNPEYPWPRPPKEPPPRRFITRSRYGKSSRGLPKDLSSKASLKRFSLFFQIISEV